MWGCTTSRRIQFTELFLNALIAWNILNRTTRKKMTMNDDLSVVVLISAAQPVSAEDADRLMSEIPDGDGVDIGSESFTRKTFTDLSAMVITRLRLNGITFEEGQHAPLTCTLMENEEGQNVLFAEMRIEL